jgi:hypothetical protein
METIVEELKRPEWWFTAVVTGLVVGVLAIYAQMLLVSWSKTYAVERGERIESLG